MSTTASPRHFHLIRLATGAAAVELFDGEKITALPPFVRDDQGVPGEYDWGQITANTVHLAYSMLFNAIKDLPTVCSCAQPFTFWLAHGLKWEDNHTVHVDCVTRWVLDHLAMRAAINPASLLCEGCGQ